MPDTIEKATFERAYTERPPWDIDGPQDAFRYLKLHGTLLDAGCGSGENALWFAAQGVDVTGIDYVEAAITQAKKKAEDRAIQANFLVRDALALSTWEERFHNAIDSGLMHTFSNADRTKYLAGLAHVLEPGGRLYLMCFSDETPGDQGPRRISRDELDSIFAYGWDLEKAIRTRFEVREEHKASLFGGEHPRGWFVTAKRL